MTVLILVRHSISTPDPTSRYDQWNLTAKGLAKCATLAARLRRYRPEYIVTSPELKAKQTADRLCAHFGLPMEIEADLAEHRRKNEPFFDRHDEFLARINDLLRRPDLLVFGEETGNEARLRLRNAIARICNLRDDATVIVVTHGTIMSLYLAEAIGVDPVAFWSGLEMPAFVAIEYPENELIELAYSVE